MTTESDFQEKLQKSYLLLASNVKELNGKDQQQLEKAMAACNVDETIAADRDNGSFNEAKLQDNMQKLCMILSHDATKLTLACKPPRKPQDAIKMIDEMSNTLYRIIGFYYDIPSSGKENQQLDINTYRKAYQNLVDGLLRGVISLLVSFMDPAKAPPSTSSSPFMLSTAALWETCKSASSLPASNRQAVFIEWKALMETLTDAKNETDEMERSSNSDLDNGNSGDDTTAFDDDMDLDVEVDAGVAKKCASLVGLTHLLFQKILKRCTLSDKLMIEGQAIVEQVDVMVSKAYDLDPEEMKPVMEEYVQKINSLIQVASTCGQENDAIWFKMCATKLSGILD